MSFFTVCKQNFKDRFILPWLYMCLCHFKLMWSISRDKYRAYLKWTGLFQQKSLLDRTLKNTITTNMRNLRSELKQADTILIYTFPVWSLLWTFSVANSAIKLSNPFWPGVYGRWQWSISQRRNINIAYGQCHWRQWSPRK